jgi:hypothetical protein
MSEQLSTSSAKPRRGRDAVVSLAWLALLGFLIFAEDAFASRWHATSRLALVVTGTVACALVIVGWLATSLGILRRRLTDASASERSQSLVDHGESLEATSISDATRPASIEPSELSRWVDAVNRLLTLELRDFDETSLPRVNLVRAGPLGIELLLESEATTVPGDFSSAGNGRVWRLDPALRLEEIEAKVNSSIAPYLPVLVRVGDDNGAIFYVAARSGESIGIAGDDVTDTMSRIVSQLVTSPWSESTVYRLGEGAFLGAEVLPPISFDPERGLQEVESNARGIGDEERPLIIVATDRGLAELARSRLGAAVLIGTSIQADHVLYRSGDSVTIEPAGLSVQLELAELLFDDARVRLQELASDRDADDSETAEEPEVAKLMPPQGVIEVRILREHPDVVGELSAPPSGAAVQFVAYLATHGGKASTSRLRDALGAYSRESSRTTATVRAAAGAARQSIGSDRLPNASANQQYELSTDVTCDWIRFEQAVKLARAEHSIGESVRAVSLLTGALDLVAGLPSPDERRFDWVDIEGLAREIAEQVANAAHLLFTIAVADGTTALAGWALEKGRLAAPESEVLERDRSVLDRGSELVS